MKQRIFSNWNLSRLLFTGMGLAFIISSLQEFDWFGLFAGIYFFSMGIFAFGCASGSCYTGNCDVNYSSNKKSRKDLNI